MLPAYREIISALRVANMKRHSMLSKHIAHIAIYLVAVLQRN